MHILVAKNNLIQNLEVKKRKSFKLLNRLIVRKLGCQIRVYIVFYYWVVRMDSSSKSNYNPSINHENITDVSSSKFSVLDVSVAAEMIVSDKDLTRESVNVDIVTE